MRKRPRKRGVVDRRAGSRSSGVPISGFSLPGVVGETSLFTGHPSRSKTLEYAERRRRRPTPAEAELERILNGLNGGVLRGKFKRERAVSGKWIVDFFFQEIRLAIEVDGSIHLTKDQLERDRQKDEDCAKLDITVLRLTNGDIAGNRNKLITKLRAGWREALNRENRIVGMSEDEYSTSFS